MTADKLPQVMSRLLGVRKTKTKQKITKEIKNLGVWN